MPRPARSRRLRGLAAHQCARRARAGLTHKVAVPRTLVFPGPSIKLPPLEGLSLGCRLAVARFEDPFAVTHSGGYVPARHLRRLDAFASDPVAVAETFLHVPYLWGGKTALGLDCSGLVQIALTACGVPCPRDSASQEAALGVALSPRAISPICAAAISCSGRATSPSCATRTR